MHRFPALIPRTVLWSGTLVAFLLLSPLAPVAAANLGRHADVPQAVLGWSASAETGPRLRITTAFSEVRSSAGSLAAPSESAGPGAAAPVAPAVGSAEVLGGWHGLHYGTNGAFADPYFPPDVQVAAGPTYVVEMVNLLMAVYTKQGTPVGVSSLASLFNAGTDFVSDPKVQYDAASGRWFASLTDVTLGQILLATSATSDPTGSWHVTPVPSSSTGECLDQPILGVGTTTVIVSVNVFTQTKSNPCTTPYIGAQYWVVRKADLLSGVAAPATYASHVDFNEGSIHPVQIEGTSAVHYMVSTYWPGNTTTTSNTLHLFAVSGTPPAAVTVGVTSLSMPTAALPPAASQLGSKNPIDTSDIRIAEATWEAGGLWLGFDAACRSDATRACIRMVEIDTTAGTILQDFDLDVAGKDVFYPAFRMDGSGDLAVVFGYSSSSDYPGIMMSARLPADPVNELQPPTVVAAGTGPEDPSGCTGTCRYGDYFGAGLDPSNASVVWLAGELGTSAGWSTFVFPSAVKAILTMDYSIRGGGSGYSAPNLTYESSGIRSSTPLTTAPTAYYADPGSSWSVTPVLTDRSTPGEFWSINDLVNNPPYLGTANRSLTADYIYFHGYSVRLGYEIHGWTALPSPPPPLVNVTVFGQPSRVPAGDSYVLDAGTNYTYANPLSSSPTERVVSNDSTGGSVTGPLNLTVNYYHQYRVTFDYQLLAAGTFAPPVVDYDGFGANTSVEANATVWADAGSSYSYTSSLGGTGMVRIGPGSNAAGTITAAGTIVVAYHLQFRLNVTVEPGNLQGSVAGGGWYDVGSTATLTATAPDGWKFMGWSGAVTGDGPTLTLAMSQPANVTALFYPGLTISAGSGGSVAYAYGAVSGVVPAGGSLTIYAPVGTQITLTAQPSSIADTFASWSGGASGTSTTTAVTLSGPMTVSAAFGPNLLVVAGIAGGLFLVILAAVLLILLARRRRKLPPA